MVDRLEGRLRQGLAVALKERDKAAIAALRTALAAVVNAEAVPAGEYQDKYREPIPGRSHEAPRLALTEAQVSRIVRAEADERRSAIDEYESLGRPDDAERLRAELAVLERYLG